MLLILFIRSTRHEETREEPAEGGGASPARLWSIIRLIGWIWAGAFIFSFLGVVVGYDSLANLIGDASLGSAYMAVILFACARVLASLLVVALHSRPMVYLQMVRRHQAMLLDRLRTILYWLVSAAWLLGVLALLSVAAPVFEAIEKILSAELSYKGLHLSLGPVLSFCLIVWISVWASRLMRFVLEEDVYNRMTLPSGIPYAISTMVNYLVLLIGFFIGVSTLGVEMTQLTILASAFTLGIGFGLQNIFNNFVSGLILLFERPVRVGDVIQMSDTTGVVGHIGIRASIIRTSDSAEIIVPNGNLISNQVTNWTLSNRQRGVMIPITLDSTVDPQKVIALLTRVAAANPLVTTVPAPQAFLIKLGGDGFSYELHLWTNVAEQWVKIRSELAVALTVELGKEHIAIK